MVKFIITLVVLFSVLFCGIESVMQSSKAADAINSRNAKIECQIEGNCK